MGQSEDDYETMKECWINVYRNADGKQHLGGYSAATKEESVKLADQTSCYGRYRSNLIGRWHVKMKDKT